jgi:hypothetical protein
MYENLILEDVRQPFSAFLIVISVISHVFTFIFLYSLTGAISGDKVVIVSALYQRKLITQITNLKN